MLECQNNPSIGRIGTVYCDTFEGCLAPTFVSIPEFYAQLYITSVTTATSGGYTVTVLRKKQAAATAAAKEDANMRDLVKSTVIPDQERVNEEGSTLVLQTPNAPVLCTEFEGSVVAKSRYMFDFVDESSGKGCLKGAPRLTKEDESTKVPGVFLVGPTVSHGSLSFCFVYNFRQRFGVVANTICQGLRIHTRAVVADCCTANMYLDDFSCCNDTCGDVC